MTRSSVGANTPDPQTSVLQSKRGGIRYGFHGQAPPSKIVEMEMLELELGDNRKRLVYGAGRRRLTPPTRVARGPERTLKLCF